MTTAFNLSQIANYLNTSGQLNLATGVSGTLPQSNGGTGATSLAAVAVTGLAAGPGISLSGSVGNVTITNTGSTGGASVVSSATDVTLTASSNRVQTVTMTTFNKRVILPDATTVTTLGGPLFIINNAGLYPFNVCTSDGYSLTTVNSGSNVTLALSSAASANANWVVGSGLGTVSVALASPSSVIPYVSSVSTAALSSTTFLITYVTTAAPTTGNAVVATISGSTITYGTPWSGGAVPAGSSKVSQCVALSSTAAFVTFADGSSTTVNRYALVISGTTITASAVSAITSIFPYTTVRKLNSTQAVFSYLNTGGDTSFAQVLQHNGTSAITAGTAVTTVTAGLALGSTPDSAALTTSSFVAFCNGYARVGTVSGTTITLGALSTLNGNIGGSYTAYGYSATECGFVTFSSTYVYTVSGTAVSFTASSSLGASLVQPSGTSLSFVTLDTVNALGGVSLPGTNAVGRFEYIPTVGFRYAGAATSNLSDYRAFAPLSTTTAACVGFSVASGTNPLLTNASQVLSAAPVKILD